MNQIPIAEKDIYLSRMTKSIIDKIFFMDKVYSHVFVDFGCADGSMIRLLANLFPEHYYIGYDYDKDMIERAKKEGESQNLRFCNSWASVSKTVSGIREVLRPKLGTKISETHYDFDMKVSLLLFSVIHEVYSYGPENIKSFWETVLGKNKDCNQEISFSSIIIRDMAVSKKTSRPSDPISAARIRQTFDPYKISQWESQWGSLDENWSLVHFLLTYHYEDNWEREYRENYLPIPTEDILAKFPSHYHPIFVDHYSLPYIRRKVENDFGIQLQERTHFKLIMERKK